MMPQATDSAILSLQRKGLQMLVITRKSGEGVWIGDSHVIVRFTENGTVKLSIDAPRDVPIRRDELPVKPRAEDKS